MGMYTELIFGASLENLPDHVVEALDYVINDKEDVSQEAIDFAEQYNLERIFWGSSYYFGAHKNKPTFVLDEIGKHHVLSTRANCKNYENQIEKFIEFITPYVESGSGYDHNIFAYVQYEEAEFPTMYGKDGVYEMNDPERVSSAEKDLNNIENILWPVLDNMIKEYTIDDETLKKAGKTSSEWTHTDTIIYCIKELERRWNQSYDDNYKELQNELKSVKSKLHDMEMEKYYLEVELKDYRKRLGEE